MDEKLILKFSLLLAIAGLIFLFIYSQQMEIPAAKSLSTLEPEETVLLKGVVSRFQAQEKVAFIEIQGERIETAEVVAFPQEELFLQQGDYVEIVGTVEEFEGKKEIIASRIVKK